MIGSVWEIEEDRLSLLLSETDLGPMTSGYAFESCNPIPLSPEVLKACGFQKDGVNTYNLSIARFGGSYNVLSFLGDYLFIREGLKEDKRAKDDIVTVWNKDLVRYFYLHQLQNLYRILTGKPLEIDLHKLKAAVTSSPPAE